MAENKKSVELEIRAQDYTGKTINDVRKNMRRLKGDLQEQSKLASRGRADFKKYADGLKQLGEEANKLGNISAIVAKLERLSTTLATQNSKVADAQKHVNDLANTIGKLGVPTKKQAEELAKLQGVLNKNIETAEKAANAYERQRIEAEAYGVNTRNLKQSQEALTKTYQRTLQTIIDMRGAQEALQKQQDFAIKSAQAQAKAERNRLNANNEALRRNLDLWRKQREAVEAAKAQAQINEQSREAIRLANEQAKAEQEKQRAIQAGLQAQRNQINAQRTSIQQQIAAAQRAAALRQNTASSRVDGNLNRKQSLDGSMGNIAASVRSATQAYRSQEESADKLAAAIQRLKTAQTQMVGVARNIDGYRKQAAELQALKREYSAVQSEYTRLNNAMRGGATHEQVARLNQLAIALKNIGAAYAQQRVAVQQSADVLNRAGVNTERLAIAENRLAQNAARSSRVLGELSSRLNGVANNSKRGADELRRFANSSRTALGFVQRLKGQIIALSAAYVGLNGAVELFNKTIQAGKDGQVLKIRTEVLADGWADTSAKELEQYFKGTAERMGLELKGVVQDASKLFVAAKENGFSVKDAQFIYEQFSGLGQLMGADAETQQGITKALSDMLSKGSIQAEELKGQLGDRLPQAMALFSKATGQSTAQLLKMMEQGKLTSDYMLDAAMQVKTQYGEQMVKMFDTVTANQARLNNAFQEWLRIIADAGVMENFKLLLKDLAAWFRSDEGKQWALNLAAAVNTVLNALRWCVQHVNQLAIAFGALLALGVGQAFAGIVFSLTFMAKNLAVMGKSLTALGERFGVISTKAQAFFRLAGTQAKTSIFQALITGAQGFLNVLVVLLRKFIGLELIYAVMKGIWQGFEKATNQTITFKDVLDGLSDVFSVIGDIVSSVFDLIQTAMEAVTTIVAGLTELIIDAYQTIVGESENSAKRSGDSWLDMFADVDGKSISTARKIARLFDTLKWAAKSAAIYAGGWIDWALKKLQGQEAQMPEFAKIAEDIAQEINETGSEARLIKRENERKNGRQGNKPYVAPETDAPTARKRREAQEDDAKARAARAKSDEQIEKARQRAEEARQKAEEAALRRLEKQMTYEKILEQRIRIRKGLEQEVIGKNQSFKDWYMGQFAAVKQQYAAPPDRYANYKSSNDGLSTAAPTGRTNAPLAKTNNTAAGNASFSQRFTVGLQRNDRNWIGRELKGACARGTRQGIEAAFGKSIGGHGNGNQLVANMVSRGTAKTLGYVEIAYDPRTYQPRVGDIQSLQRTSTAAGSVAGHTGVWGADGLHSDGRQRNAINGTIAFRQNDYQAILNGTNKLRILRKVDERGNPMGDLVRSNFGRAIMGGKPLPVTVQSPNGGKPANGVSPQDRAALDYYNAQTRRWKAANADGKAEANDDRREEQFNEFMAQIRQDADRYKLEFLEKLGVSGVTGLMNKDPNSLTLDLSDSSLDELIKGIQSLKQPDIEKSVDMMLEVLAIDYHQANGGKFEAATEWAENLRPHMQKYMELQVQKAMREQGSAFIEAINDRYERMDTERSNRAAVIASQSARGELSADDAHKQIVEINNRFITDMNTIIGKLDELIGSSSFQTLSSDQQAAVLKSREDLISKRQNPAQGGGRQAADAALDAMNDKLKQAVQEQVNYEKMLDMQVQAGMITMGEHYQKLQAFIQGNKQGMVELIEKAREMMLALGDTASAEKLAMLAETLGQVNIAAGRTQTQVEFLNTANQKLQDGAMLAFESLAQGMASVLTGQMSFKEALAETGQALAKWAADALLELGKVILKTIILNQVTRMLGLAGGGLGVAGGAVPLFHTGGLVGGGAMMNKTVNPLVFVGATRYHSGGIAGLAPNEVPAILQKGEEVLTKQDPRHRSNGGGAVQGGNGQLTVINTFDPREAQRMALASSSGRKVLVQAAARERKAFNRLNQ